MAQYYSLPGGGTTTSLSTAQAAYKEYNKAQSSAPVSSPAPAPTTESGTKTTKVYTLPDGTTTTNQAVYENAMAMQAKREQVYEITVDGRTAKVSAGVARIVQESQEPIYRTKEGITTTQKPKEELSTAGTYTAAPTQFKETPLTFANLPEKLTTAGSRLEYSRAKTTDPYERFGLSVGSFAVGAGAAIVTPFIKPKETILGTIEMVKHPVRTAEEIGAGFATAPGYTAGQLYGTYLLGKAAGGVFEETMGKKLPKVKYEDVKIPTQTETISVYRGLTVGDRPVIGISESKLKLGEPAFQVPEKVVREVKTGYVPETKVEARFFQNLVERKYGAIEAEKLSTTIELIKPTEYTKSMDISTLPKETKTLSPRGVAVVQKFTQQEKGFQYGSFTAEAQLPKGKLAEGRGITSGPVAGDIDIQFKVGEAEAIVKAQRLTTELQKVGEPVQLSKKTPTLIETMDGSHAVDIHSLERPIDLGSAGEGGLGFPFGQKPLKIKSATGERIEVMPLAEFRTRKATSISQIGEKGLEPAAHRMKDIPDYLVSQEYLTRVAGRTQDLPKVQRLKEIYGLQPGEKISGRVTFGPSEYKSPSVRSPSIPSMAPGLPASPSLSPSASLSPSSVYVSSSPLVSPSVSPSVKVSYPASGSLSPKISPSVSPSPMLKSPSVSPSMDLSRSISPSVKPSKSPSISPRPSRSISPSVSLPKASVPAIGRMRLNLPDSGRGLRERPKKGRSFYIPSLTAAFANLKARSGPTKGLTGFEVRPFLSSAKRRRKK